MEKLTFESLVGTMKGSDTTQQWDILVSYDEDKLNELLNADPVTPMEKWDKFTGTAVLDDDPDDREEREYEFAIETKSVLLSLRDKDGRAHLKGNLGGTYQQIKPVKKEPKPIKAGYKLVVKVDLYNVRGSIPSSGPKTFTAERVGDKLQYARTNYVIQLDSGADGANAICLSFEDANGSLEEPQNTADKMSSMVKDALLDGINSKLGKVKYEHCITALKKYTPDPSMTVLQPTSFCFSVVPGDPVLKRPGTVTMWISVMGGSGNKPSGQTALQFQPDGIARNPIPATCSASIIFRHDLMANSFFMPSLKPSFENLKLTSRKGTNGMTFTGNLISGDVEVPELRSTRWVGKNSYFWNDCDAVSFSPKNPLTNITVSSDVATTNNPPVVISYASPEKSLNWSKGFRDLNDPGKPIRESGVILTTFNWSSVGKWNGGTLEHPNVLELQFKNDPRWTLDSHAEKPGWFEKWFQGKSETLPPYWQQVRVPGPNVTFSIKALDYFMVTNLLFPGLHTFQAHEPVADSAKKSGLAGPRDIILTGDIKTSFSGHGGLTTRRVMEMNKFGDDHMCHCCPCYQRLREFQDPREGR